ncbi:MAG: GNAT family N-acetyltransferase [Actinomycetes bacterium]
MTADDLVSLDRDRRAAGEPSAHGHLVREHSPDGAECRIAYSHCTAEEIDGVIRDEVLRADSGGYTLEWKLYGHDTPPGLADRLLAAGFEPNDEESVLVLPVSDSALAAFDAPGYEIRRVHDAAGVHDVAEISREIGRTNTEEERRRLETALRDTPDRLSVHVAYVEGEPVACGRIYFKENSDVAELAGGRTKTTHRNRGLFTALVATRLREALARGRTLAFVDALPTSEPILRKRGFRFVTSTQPFVYAPRL